MKEKNNKFVKVAYFMQDYWPAFVTNLSTIALLFTSFWFASWFASDDQIVAWGRLRVGAGISFIIFYFFGQFGSINKLQSVEILTREKESLTKENIELKQVISLFGEDYPAILRTRLGVIAAFFDYDHTERISLYKYEEGSYIMIGRFSHNTQFNRTGRGEYPDGQGCIDIAYREGKSVILNLPDPYLNGEEYYKEVEQKYNIPKKIMKKCNMKSRSYVAFALMDETGLNKSAVIVFESTKENGLDPETLDHAMKGVNGQALVNLMRALKHMEPSVSLAKKMGL